MTIHDVLTRCDIQVLQELLGKACTRLLALLDPTMSSPTFLRRLVLESIGPTDLLLNKSSRSHLLMLLRGDEPERLCACLGINGQQDPYNALRTLSVSRGSSREESLFNFFELPTPANEFAEVLPDESEASSGYPLFQHQRTASREVLTRLREQPHRVLLHMPTGSGKTRTAMNVICDHLRRSEPTIVVWLAHSEELCDQAADEFNKAWSFLGNRSIAIKRYWGHHRLELSGFEDGILIAGLPKMIRLAKRSFVSLGTIGSKSSLVVLDEAHQAVALEYKRILEALLAHHSNSAILGLSATPGRTWNDINADEELAAFFSRRKVSLHIDGYNSPVDFLVKEGYLAKVDFKSLFYNPGFKLGDEDLNRLHQSLDVPDSILELLGEDEMRNLSIVTKVEELSNRHSRIIIFASSVRHSELISNILRARGLEAASVTTKTSPIRRSNCIERFRSEEAKTLVLCNYGVLTTGFDAPKTSCAIIARPTKSLILYSQMIGRAIRGTKVGGNCEAEIVTVIDQQLPGFGGVAEAFANWEDIWTH